MESTPDGIRPDPALDRTVPPFKRYFINRSTVAAASCVLYLIEMRSEQHSYVYLTHIKNKQYVIFISKNQNQNSNIFVQFRV